MKIRFFFLVSILILTACGLYVAETNGTNKISTNGKQIGEIEKNADLKKDNSTVHLPSSGEQAKTEKLTENNMAEESTMKSISLRAKAKKSDDKLIIEYEIENHAEQNLYVWDRMIGYNKSGQFIDEERAYVFWEEPKTIRVVRANLPLPFDRDVARKEIPFVRSLAAREKINGKIVLDLPVPEYSPFYPPLSEETTKKEKASVVRLLIGWSEFREGMVIREQTVGGKNVLAIRGNWEKPYHKLLAKEMPVEAEILVHSDAFDRAMPFQ